MFDWSNFFSNATIAGLITVGAGALVAKCIYKEQKKIDRQHNAEDKLGENLLLLEEHCKAVNQTIDRLAGTYIRITEDKDEIAAEKFVSESLMPEIEEASKVLMLRLPEDLSKIESITTLYFQNRQEIKEKTEAVFSEIKKWHDFVQDYATGRTNLKFDLSKRVKETPELSLENLNLKIKDLMSLLHKS